MKVNPSEITNQLIQLILKFLIIGNVIRYIDYFTHDTQYYYKSNT